MDDAEFLKKYGDLCTEAITRRIKLEPDIFFVELPGKGKNSVKVILVRKGYAGISVSKEALAFGIELGDFLVFPVKSPIGYELLHQLVVHDITDLSKFQFASECCGKYPDYFGQVPPAPAGTPFGVGYRYFSVAPGVYFIETLDGYCLAVSYEVWRYDLSDETVHESYSFNTDLQTGLLNARSYIFFRCEECELAVFELLETGKYPVLEKYLVSPLALYERLWATHPEFLENWNNQVMDKAKRVCGPFRDLANLASTLQLVPKWVDRQPQCVDFLSLPGYRDEGSISESDDDEEYILEHYDGRWGKIKTIEESSPGVFLVNHDDNDVAGRYILLQDFGESVLSHQAISYGDSMNGLIYFDIDSGSPVVLFELLRSIL